MTQDSSAKRKAFLVLAATGAFLSLYLACLGLACLLLQWLPRHSIRAVVMTSFSYGTVLTFLMFMFCMVGLLLSCSACAAPPSFSVGVGGRRGTHGHGARGDRRGARTQCTPQHLALEGGARRSGVPHWNGSRRHAACCSRAHHACASNPRVSALSSAYAADAQPAAGAGGAGGFALG